MYNKEIDKKWQKEWEDKEIYKFNENGEGEKYYMLEMFSYPSGAKLHIGHWFNYALGDSFARFKKMQGYNVFHPMGFDSFGLPAENYAIKTGVHPEDSTEDNIKNMTQQLKEMGASFDWSHTLNTHLPEYYKWTQWLFLQLYKNDLAYRKKSLVNWCPNCNTVLANEQVISGACERCDTIVERKNLKQWFFRITKYAEELLKDLDKLDWPEKTKKIQKNWIGKSIGTNVKFKLENPIIIDGEKKEFLETFTTRVDTLFGITFLSIAPESDYIEYIVTEENKDEVHKYLEKTKKISELERQFTDREKTGVFTGSYVIHPFLDKKIPIYIADYVIGGYGEGAVMGVPAHDERDFEFAKKKNLEIIQVISKDGKEEKLEQAYVEQKGILINSGSFDSLEVNKAKEKITEELNKIEMGEKKTNYKLKDWLVSRQRYWGAPIPIIYCDSCGIVPVPEEDLPVKLPYDVEFSPTGESPLAKNEEFINCKCPICGKDAKREADTLDTFVCSSWYELRYPSVNVLDKAFDKKKTKELLPVDTYIGGAEHAAMHLIYTRFIKKALRDMGYINFGESFKRLRHQGLILGPDGNKMSKSKGNTIAPDGFVEKYGSDVLRMYLMFGFTFEEGGPWDNNGIKAMNKYIQRVDNYFYRLLKNKEELKEDIEKANSNNEKNNKELDYEYNRVLAAITRDLENFSFNTAVARLMELTNVLVKHEQDYGYSKKLEEISNKFIKMLSVVAPHFAQELWVSLGNNGFVYNEKWETVDKDKLEKSTMNLPIQINGKVRAVLEVDKNLSEEELKEQIYKDENIGKHLEGKKVVKEIYIKNKIYNIVVK